MALSPLAPAGFPAMPDVAGVTLATATTGSRYKARTDFLMASFDDGTVAAGVLTRSKTASAPVDWCRRSLSHGSARALLVNAGNANAFTGSAGDAATEAVADAAMGALSCTREEIYLASTGVIGEPLDPAPLAQAVAGMAAASASGEWQAAARAIMTTDTFPKGAVRQANIDGVPVTLCGIVKGSGMIAPDMATMLGFIFTDAAIAREPLQALLAEAVDASFNAITVDSDTSTSDTVLLFATGAAGHPAIAAPSDPRLADFRDKLAEIARDLAFQVVRDGEGATKFVAITVTGAEDNRAARTIAKSIANSPLVKTAIAGEDPNWGRIVMAVGKAGERANRDRLNIEIGGHRVATGGQVDPAFDEPVVAQHMKGQEIDIAVDVGIGRGRSTMWTCDLTHAYIDINADYRS